MGMATARDAALGFIEALRSTPFARAQLRLLNTADRDLGAVLYPLGDEERELIYRAVGPSKAGRLRSEVVRMGHVLLDAETVRRISEHLSRHLAGDRPLGPASRYFRPHAEGGSARR
jgi:hypothetical protein